MDVMYKLYVYLPRWFRGWFLFKHYAKYFPIQLIKTCDLDPSKSYLFGSHPHGILCFGAFCSFATDALGFEQKFPGLRARLLTLNQQVCTYMQLHAHVLI